MSDNQITCINKSSLLGQHEHITRVGNPSNGWSVTVAEAVQLIKQRVHTFHVRDSRGNRAEVGVVEPTGRTPYLRTYADGVWTDNLLSLTSCPL